MADIGEVRRISTNLLRPYEKNAKKHSPAQIRKIADSIKEFGFLNPVLIDKNYNVIAGHGRIMAMKELGETEVPCLFVEGLTEAQRRAYILADNRLTELGDWDRDLVSSELEALNELGFDLNLTGFSIDDIVITDEMAPTYTDEDLEEDVVTSQTKVNRGEVWILGRHVLMCGDSTNKEDVEKLVGGGYESRPFID